MHETEFEQLIQSITDLVLAKLRSSSHLAQRPRTLTVLWPVATASKDPVLAGVSAFRQEHGRVQWLMHEDLLDGLKPLLSPEERSQCHSLSGAPVQSILADMLGTDVVLVAAIHFEAARQLLALNDGLPWIHVLLQAHLSGQRVVICDELLSGRGLAAQNPVAQEGAALKRQLRQMGFTLTPAPRLAKVLKDFGGAAHLGPQEERQLVTEQDVEDLVRAGHREVRLHAKTLVTPLAQSKAAELGLQLVRTQA